MNDLTTVISTDLKRLCINSVLHKERNKSASNDSQFVPIGIPECLLEYLEYRIAKYNKILLMVYSIYFCLQSLWYVTK